MPRWPVGCSPRPDAAVEEVALHGGTANRGQVVRVGDTVRRPARRTSPATAALLRHLEAVGFDGAPRYLGLDDAGREMLTYVPGEPVTPPYPSWALTDEALVGVASLLRRYHDAVAGFDPRGHTWPGPVPERFRTSLVTHNDPNLDNVVFRGGRAVALIDFDLAAPGCRVWDVVAASRFWAPLRADADIEDSRHGRGLARARLFVDAYGLSPRDRGEFADALLANHDWLYGIVRTAAEDGHDAFGAYWHGGGRQRASRTRRWYEASLAAVREALG